MKINQVWRIKAAIFSLVVLFTARFCFSQSIE